MSKKGLLRCRVFGHRWEQVQRAGVWWFSCRRCGEAEPESSARDRVTPPAATGGEQA